MFPIKTLLGPFPGVSCRCHTCSGSHMPHKPFTNCSLADGGAGHGFAVGEAGIHGLCLFLGCSRQQRKEEESWHPPPCKLPLCRRGKTFPYPFSILELSCEPFLGCRKCFHLVPHCLKAVGNGVSVLGRWRPSFLPGRWYWFVLVADGQSALRAKAENQSSEGAEIYCSRKLKMYASAYGVAPVLPLSVWGGVRAPCSALLCGREV